MSTITLGTPLAEEAIRNIHFFNGRLLTGGDLQREQAARQLADRRVGAALGPGVAWGLEVTGLGVGAPGRVQVQAGLGVSFSGAVLHLATSPEVHLVAPPAQATASVLGGFGPCGPLRGGTYVAGAGLFLLTLAPVTLAAGKAPVLALDPVNTRCSTDAHVEAVQFRLLRVNETDAAPVSNPAAVAKMRSRIARACLLGPVRAAAHAQPGTQPLGAGALPGLAVPGLSDCEVPLALVYMQGNVIVFVERWAVRRRLASDAASPAWAPWLGGRVNALAEAQMLHFQDHITDSPAVLQAAATDTLQWLPPAGFLPSRLTPVQWRRFLGARAPAQEVPLAAADAPDVLAGALRADAIDLQAPAADGRLRVYRLGGAGTSGGGALMFVRDARNVHHAQQVWADGPGAGLPGVQDVQAGLAMLRAGTCLHVVLRPDMDFATVLARLPERRDVTVCFEPGHYKVERPLTLAKLGRVRLHGHGALIESQAGECAVLIDSCRAAQVHDLQVAGGRRVGGRGEPGLNGALSVLDTPEVDVRQVQARCASAEGLQAVALLVAVRDETLGRLPDAQFVVADCELRGGDGQQGLLCVNGGSVTLQGNRVLPLEARQRMQRGIVVGGRQAGQVRIEANQVRGAVRGIAVGVSEAAGPEAAPLRAERVVVLHNHVEVQVPDETSGSRYGIFIGNAVSVQASANSVALTGTNPRRLPLDGLRLNGDYGPHLVVRDNLFEGMHSGIVLQSQKPPGSGLWVFQCNLGLRLTGRLLNGVMATDGGLVVSEHNREAA